MKTGREISHRVVKDFQVGPVYGPEPLPILIQFGDDAFLLDADTAARLSGRLAACIAKTVRDEQRITASDVGSLSDILGPLT